MKFFNTTYSNIGDQFSLRIDAKYRDAWDTLKGDPVAKSSLNKVKVADLLSPIPIKKIKKGELEDEYNLLSISDTEAKYGRLENSLQPVLEIGSDKTILSGAEFIISKLVMSKGYIFTNQDNIKDIIGSTELIPYKKRRNDLDLTFLRHLLLLDEYLGFYASLETGKTPSQKRVNPTDILQMLLPDVPSTKQREVGTKIKHIENEIDQLSKEIESRNEIINSIFSEVFNIDFNSVEENQKPASYKKDLGAVTNSFDLRFSYKYNATKYDNLLLQISKNNVKPLKEYISETIRLGSSISPSDYDENGEGIYISMSSIKHWKVDTEGSRKVSDEYFDRNKIVNSVKKGDILIARSGEGTIGKVAFVEEKYDGIFADFTMRVRIAKGYNPKYFYYYFCSDLFQLLVEKEKKGLGNNTNFFPNQLKRFPIIDIPLRDQNSLVDKIEKRLNKVVKAEQALIQKKEEIDNLIRISIS
jgi:restriction endonuclease S subunit